MEEQDGFKPVPQLDKTDPDLRLGDIAHTDWVQVLKGDKLIYIHYLSNISTVFLPFVITVSYHSSVPLILFEQIRVPLRSPPKSISIGSLQRRTSSSRELFGDAKGRREKKMGRRF